MCLLIPTVHNVKCRFNTKKSIVIPTQLKRRVSNFYNFYVLRLSHYTFTVFQKTSFVNVTGVRNFEDIDNALFIFNVYLNQKVEKEDIVIDCTTASGKTVGGKTLDLVRIKNYIDRNKSEDATASFNPHYFPAAIVRRKKQGTTILFRSGSYIIVGSKSSEGIKSVYKSTCRMLKNATMREE